MGEDCKTALKLQAVLTGNKNLSNKKEKIFPLLQLMESRDFLPREILLVNVFRIKESYKKPRLQKLMFAASFESPH